MVAPEYARAVFRRLMARKARTLGMIAAIALGSGVLGAIQMALQSIPGTLRSFYEWTAFADLQVAILPEDIRNLPDLGSIPGVAAVERRLIFPGTATLEGGRILTCALILLESPEPTVNKLHLIGGRMFTPLGGEAVIERGLARYHGLGRGDTLRLRVGEKEYADEVSGIALSPEFFVTTSNPDYALKEKGSLGVVFGDLDRMSEGLGFTLVNDIAIRFRKGADRVEVRKRVLEALADCSIEKVAWGEEGFSHQKIMFGIRTYSIYTWAIILSLLLLSIIVTGATCYRFHLERRQEIGTLFAQGQPLDRAILMQALVGGAIGLLGGLAAIPVSILGRNLFTANYAEAQGIPLVIELFNGPLAAGCVLLSVAIGAAACSLTFLLVAREPVHSLLRPRPRTLDRGSSSGFLKALSWLGPSASYSLRNLARKPLLNLVSILALAFAVSVPIAYGICTTSNIESIRDAFDGDSWRIAVDLKHPFYAEDALPAAPDPEAAPVPYFRHYVELHAAGGRRVAANMLGIDPGNTLKKLRVKLGRTPRAGRREVVLSRDLAGEIGAVLGSKVAIGHMSRSETFTLVGMTSDYFTRQVILPIESAQEVCMMPGKITGYYLGAGREAARPVPGEGPVARVTEKSSLIASLERLGRDSMGIVRVAMGFSLLMTLAFAFILMSLAVAERMGEFSILLSMGYSKRGILALVLWEVTAQLVLATALCFPLAAALAALLNDRMSRAWFDINMHYRLPDFSVPVGLTLALAPIIAAVCAREAIRPGFAAELRDRNAL